MIVALVVLLTLAGSVSMAIWYISSRQRFKDIANTQSQILDQIISDKKVNEKINIDTINDRSKLKSWLHPVRQD